MVTRAYFARRFLALKLLRGALVAGALYDASLAVLLLWRPAAATALLGSATSGSAVTAGLTAISLAMLAGLGVAAARDFRRYSAIVAALISGRAAAALLLGGGAVVTGSALPGAALWNALLAITLAAAWWPQRR